MTLRNFQDLENAGLAGPDDEAALAPVLARYQTGISRAALRTMRVDAGRPREPLTDPVALQYVPQAAELDLAPGERADPIGDLRHSPVPGIVHRYPDRVLLMPVTTCAVYCRYCFRKERLGPGKDALTKTQLDAAIAYIANNPAIWEVILTGGDPLILSPARLSSLLARLQAIGHVQVIRIHTRVPVAVPDQVTPALIAALTIEKPLYIALHINHAQELSAEVAEALARLCGAGAQLLSQTVLLRGVNDDAATLETLFRALVLHKVRPYYLHHPDMTPGTGHFRLGVAEGQEIMRQLRGRLSGIALPTYVLDIPDGYGKVPLGPAYYEGNAVTDPRGAVHAYPPGDLPEGDMQTGGGAGNSFAA